MCRIYFQWNLFLEVNTASLSKQKKERKKNLATQNSMNKKNVC